MLCINYLHVFVTCECVHTAYLAQIPQLLPDLFHVIGPVSLTGGHIALGMESGAVTNNQVSASSMYGYPDTTFYPPWQARLGSNVDAIVGREAGFWRPVDPWASSWIQVSLIITTVSIDTNFVCTVHVCSFSVQKFALRSRLCLLIFYTSIVVCLCGLHAVKVVIRVYSYYIY